MKNEISIKRIIIIIDYNEHEEDIGLESYLFFVKIKAKLNMRDINLFDKILNSLFMETCLHFHDRILIQKDFIIKDDNKFLYLKDESKILKNYCLVTNYNIYDKTTFGQLFYETFIDKFDSIIDNFDTDTVEYNKEIQELFEFVLEIKNEEEDEYIKLKYPFEKEDDE